MTLRACGVFGFVLSVLAAVTVSPTQVRAATLVGSTVTGTLYYPDLSTVYVGSTGPQTVPVGAGVEFPAELLQGDTLFTIDITANQLIYRPLANVTYGGGVDFNGFVFDFSGAPTILGVSVNAPGSNFNPVSLSFTGNSVTFDLQNLTVFSSSVLVLDFTLADTVVTPLPAALPLFATGLGALGLLGWRRKRKGAAVAA